MTPDKPLRADARRNRARILAAAEEVFAEHGDAASTEEVAARAGVAIGTVFRHFPTKRDLLAAIMKDLRARLVDRAQSLAAEGDPATALFDYFGFLVESSARIGTVVSLLAEEGTSVEPGEQVRALTDRFGAFLEAARDAGTVRPGVRLDEVMALLTATVHGAVAGAWSDDLRHRTVARVLDALRAAEGPGTRKPRGTDSCAGLRSWGE
ncbi:TetR/AcrR family transcriptional regulator [Streptomonospora nanhaiensis]|uniref:TetR/AcrR family transcriptional regulator n=1 Tax=Streptomonospora nanhaiensis TaxID=1323731 RepID=UPI0015CABB93|nr:TetR/AcrR family transcriptional regulator [Streptomonospora nanhaiensis]MBV2363226.1 TetR/AcrR family transcriptional regulator; helix-turn-helix transcriptional regulator [Streptomonospora nanhaiensis]MBX9389917.1 TetR/AcrR family transcriptional regulator; helix-turn-helix transcriptional regulator [Streptomonospora nanhaiensis]